MSLAIPYDQFRPRVNFSETFRNLIKFVNMFVVPYFAQGNSTFLPVSKKPIISWEFMSYPIRTTSPITVRTWDIRLVKSVKLEQTKKQTKTGAFELVIFYTCIVSSYLRTAHHSFLLETWYCTFPQLEKGEIIRKKRCPLCHYVGIYAHAVGESI